jgi:hypothetical protein
MKTIRGILIAIIVLGGADLARGADVTAQTGFQLDWWKDSSKNVGYQGIIPLKVSTQMQNFSASILGGYAYTS